MRLVYIQGLLFLVVSAAISAIIIMNAPQRYTTPSFSTIRMAVCTTTLIADAVKEIAGDTMQVVCLMGPGIDPHTYRAREGDVHRLAAADIVFYHGLHLEGRMETLIQGMRGRVPVVSVSGTIDQTLLCAVEDGIYDPHVWHDVSLWKTCVAAVVDALTTLNPSYKDYYAQKADAYDARLSLLDTYVAQTLNRLPAHRRIVVTAHDAFYYFAQRYGITVIGLQGMSTDAEVTIHDIEKTIELIMAHKVPALFVESSLSSRAIHAVKEGVESQGGTITIGTDLYSDSLGSSQSDAATYEGMIRHNTDALCAALS